MVVQVRWIFVPRDTHVERVASRRSGQRLDWDYTQEIVPFAETILFKILAPENRVEQLCVGVSHRTIGHTKLEDARHEHGFLEN